MDIERHRTVVRLGYNGQAGDPIRFLVRLSPDLTTKAGKTRRRFLRMLIANLRDALQAEGIPATVQPGWVRLVVEANEACAADPGNWRRRTCRW
jgi:hypothetical protein